MTVRIIHCADLHLDSRMTAHLDKKRAYERNIELLQTFNRMVEYADSNDVEAILISGDLFDTPVPAEFIGDTVLDGVREHPDILFFYLKGNHDEDNVFPGDIPVNLKMFNDKWRSYSMGDVVITGLELNEKNDNIASHYLVLDKEKFNILMLHGDENYNHIKMDDYREKNIDYMALGHIHAFKKGIIDDRGVYCYPGCLEGRGFDECGEHGFVLIDIDEERRTFSMEFIPVAKRRMYQVSPDVSECTSDNEILHLLDRELADCGAGFNDYIKVVLKGNISSDRSINTLYITDYLQEKYEYAKVYDETDTLHDDYAYDESISLKGEFVRLVKNSDETEEDKAAILKMGISVITKGVISR